MAPTRYEGGQYTSEVIGYDTDYRPTGRKVTIRPDPDLDHPLTVRRDCGLLAVEPDAFRPGHVQVPYRRTYADVPSRDVTSDSGPVGTPSGGHRLVLRQGARFNSQVLGSHFEHLCREWVMDFASTGTFGGLPLEASSGTVPGAERRISHELDVVVRGTVGQDTGILLSIGEAKYHGVRGRRWTWCGRVCPTNKGSHQPRLGWRCRDCQSLEVRRVRPRLRTRATPSAARTTAPSV